MKNFKIILCVIFVFVFGLKTQAQPFTSTGSEFYLTYIENLDLIFNGSPQFSIFIDADIEGTAVVEAPVTGFSVAESYGPGLNEIVMPNAIYYAEGSEQISNFGLKITTSSNVKAFAVHYRLYFSEATMLLPATMLGTNYTVMAGEDFQGDPGAYSSFVVTATEDNTTIEITPAALTAGLRPPGLPFTVTLPEQGNSYQVHSNGDLTGSKVVAADGKKVAVFGGALKANIGDCFADSHLYEQMHPNSRAGSSFGFIPFSGQDYSVLKVVAIEDGTEIFMNGNQQANLNEGDFFEMEISAATVIEASKPVFAYQLNPGQDCMSSGIGDPNLLQLAPLNMKMTNANFRNLTEFGGNFVSFTNQYVTIVAETNMTGMIELDGNMIGNDFDAIPNFPEYSFVSVALNSDMSELNCPEGCLAYAYGFGDYDAYTYHLNYDEPVMVSSTEEAAEDVPDVFPNPVSNIINIEYKDINSGVLSIYDLSGRSIFNKIIKNNIDRIVVEDWPAGVYWLQVESERGNYQEKIIVVK